MSFLARSARRGRVQPLVSGPWSKLRIAEGSMVIGMGFLKTEKTQRMNAVLISL